MNFTHPFHPRSTQLFKGGGSTAAPTVLAPPPAVTPPPAIVNPPVTPAPQLVAPAAPAASLASPSVTQVQTDARRAAAKKRGLNSTILTGAGAQQDNSSLGGAGGRGTLLGGG